MGELSSDTDVSDGTVYLISFLLSLGVLQSSKIIATDLVLSSDIGTSLAASPILTLPSILLVEFAGIDLWQFFCENITPSCIFVEIQGVVYTATFLGLGTVLHYRPSERVIRAARAFLSINLLFFVSVELLPSVPLSWTRLVIYVGTMSLGIYLTGIDGESRFQRRLGGGAPANTATGGQSTPSDDGQPSSGRQGAEPAASDTAPPTPDHSGDEDTRRDSRRQQLQDEVASLRAALDRAETLAEGGDLRSARPRLADLESPLTSVAEAVAERGFDDLHDEAATLERRRAERLADVTERLAAPSAPSRIPRAPDVSVEYEALTDEEPIGGGGNADVSKATLPGPTGNVTLAIKRPRMAGTLHTDAVSRLLDEAETWDQLDDHDHIVGVVDYGDQPVPWIAMEYMDGGHLGDRSGELELPQALWTAIAVTKGVRHAHRRGVAHLDLKPANVLFRTVDGAWDVPKVADWGLSKHLLDHSKSVDGLSVHYAAPEQFDDSGAATDDITDVYQLGAVFYELFTGRQPFEGQPFSVIEQIKNTRPTPPSEVANVPPALDDVLLTALAKEKADRYEDIILLRNALQDVSDEW